MKKATKRLLLKWSYVVSALLFVLSVVDVFVWRGRYQQVAFLATVLLVLFLVLLLLTRDKDAYRPVPVEEKQELRTIVRWS